MIKFKPIELNEMMYMCWNHLVYHSSFTFFHTFTYVSVRCTSYKSYSYSMSSFIFSVHFGFWSSFICCSFARMPILYLFYVFRTKLFKIGGTRCIISKISNVYIFAYIKSTRSMTAAALLRRVTVYTNCCKQMHCIIIHVMLQWIEHYHYTYIHQMNAVWWMMMMMMRAIVQSTMGANVFSLLDN